MLSKYLLFISLVLFGSVALADDDRKDKDGDCDHGSCVFYGDVATIGDGTVKTFVEVRKTGAKKKPVVVGVEFTDSAIMGLPEILHDGNNCYDVDGDGILNIDSFPHECSGGHQRIMFFPPEANTTPFKWMLFNWNPQGHLGWPKPHFDFHFYIQDYVDRNYIRPGPCALLINCDDYEKAVEPVPAQYMPMDYGNLGLVEGRMGNHLVDTTVSSPDNLEEIFLYGSYGGRITFWEPMITLKRFGEKLGKVCTDVKLPMAYVQDGYYPTKYCIAYNDKKDVHFVTLEGFVYRKQS